MWKNTGKTSFEGVFIDMKGKKVIITESQRERIFEAAWPSFSMYELEKLDDWEKYDYAVKMLGEPMAEGSSRVVFDIDDDTVLKLAINDTPDDGVSNNTAGCEQNRVEAELYKKTMSKILPKIYYVSNDFSFIICERVFQADMVDFERYLGIPFLTRYMQNTSHHHGREGEYVPVGYDKYFGDELMSNQATSRINFMDIAYYIEDVYLNDSDEVDDEFEKVIDESWWLTDLRRLMVTFGLKDISLANFGIVRRDGEEMLVVLDSGMDEDVYENYYSYR